MTKCLIICAAWAKDNSESSRKVMLWYLDNVLTRFSHMDKIISFNYGSDEASDNILLKADNIIDVVRVPQELHINSDAAPYQCALKSAREVIDNYDAVLFFQTKGASYEFDIMSGYRDIVLTNFFSHPNLLTGLTLGKPIFRCYRAFMDPFQPSIEATCRFAEWFKIQTTPLSLVAAYTNFLVTADVVGKFLSEAPMEFFEEPISSWGGNRYLFECVIPSMFVALGADLDIIGDVRHNDHFSVEVSYDCDAAHSSAIAIREYKKYRDREFRYIQRPIPYVLGAELDARKITIAFGA